MATWNGERYIREQLQSILPQLRPGDEIVIVDDVSSDGTLDRVAEFRSDAIRVIRHTQNKGVVPTFEDALRAGTGEILFLSDQDDVWAPDKVEKMLAEFQRDPLVTLVATNLAVIDEHGRPVVDRRYERHFRPGVLATILKNTHQGSTMAIRAQVVQQAVPFPVFSGKKVFAHDAWIAIQNRLHGGKTVYLDEPLLFYRRHDTNDSQPLPFARQLKLRVFLIGAILRRLWQRAVGQAA